MDETTSIGIIDLKTCIEAVIQCSPELSNQLGGDFTVYAYDYSEYETPLVGQGMLSRALAAASPYAPAQQSEKLITGRVCKNIMGIFNNGVKETLEVKLRLVPVPTMMQGEYISTMEKYREMGNSTSSNDQSEWGQFLQSNPSMAQIGQGQMPNRYVSPSLTVTSQQRGSMNLEVVNQLLSPSIPPPELSQDSFNQATNLDSGNESRGGPATAVTGKAKKISRPSSRTAVKRPYRKRQPKVASATNAGGNTSGYEEGTDGDDGPAPRKRAKITQTDWNSKSSFGPGAGDLRVAASTSGSLRMFRPVALGSRGQASHLEEVPRPPTPLPALVPKPPFQSSLRRSSFTSQIDAPRKHVSPYPQLEPSVPPEDQVRYSIESAQPSPERTFSPVETPEIGSSPPVMRTASPIMRSSPPCPSSPVLPRMPRADRTDSGFMSGSMEELFGEEEAAVRPCEDEIIKVAPEQNTAHRDSKTPTAAPEEIGMGVGKEIIFEEQIPGPMELLPTKMPRFNISATKAAYASKELTHRAGSVMSEDGQSLTSINKANRSMSRANTPTRAHDFVPPQAIPQNMPSNLAYSQHPSPNQGPLQQDSTALYVVSQPSSNEQAPLPTLAPSQTQVQLHPGSRMMARTSSMGSVILPTFPASDPILPPSSLQRSQTWSEAPRNIDGSMPLQIAAPMGMQTHISIADPSLLKHYDQSGQEIPYSRTHEAKKTAIKKRLETAIARGEMPTFCENCGAIETPSWRKAWSQIHQGVPGYYEYSDLPGRVTAIVVLSRDDNNQPTSFQLLKKYLGPEDDQTNYKEFFLCNREY
jgi:hypothetical protein